MHFIIFLFVVKAIRKFLEDVMIYYSLHEQPNNPFFAPVRDKHCHEKLFVAAKEVNISKDKANLVTNGMK